MITSTPKAEENFEIEDLVERIEIKLNKKQEDELVIWINEERSKINQGRSSFVERYKKYLYNWDDFVTYNRNGPWEGSSSLHMPITAIKVRSYVSRIYNIFTNEQTTQLVPRETSDDKFVEYMKTLRTWYLWDYLNNYKGIRGFAREVFTDCVTIGFGIGMKDFHTQVRKVIDIEPQELKREMDDMAPQIQEANGDLMQTEEEMASQSISTKSYKEVEKILTVFQGTRLRSIPFENIYFPNYIPESSDLDFPKCVVVETTMPVSEVMTKVKQGIWDKKRGKKLRDKGDQELPDKSSENIASMKSRLSGYEEQPSQGSGDRLVEYCFCTYDIDGDGIDEEIVVTKCENDIIKVTLLDRISPSGMRPLFKFDCFSKPRQSYARGVPEFLYPLNEEADQHHNMRIDSLALQTCPFGVYRGASSLKNEPIQISPGKFIPVDEITDMRVLNFPVNATALAGEEDRSWHFADLLTSSSSLNQGIVPQQVGPTRSTSGVMALLRQMDKEFIITVDALAQPWKKMERMILDDLDTRISAAVKMRVLGASVQDALANQTDPNISNALKINSQFDMRIDVARLVTSEEVKRNDAEMILNKVTAPGLSQETGVITPKSVFWAWENWLKAFGEDPSQVITKSDMIDKALTLYQEIQFIAQGELPPMAMQDNHQEKAQGLQAFMQSPEFAEAMEKGLYQPSSLGLFQGAIQKHMMIGEALAKQAQTNPMGQNGASANQEQAGAAPQQGGPSPEKTTSRDLPSEAKALKEKGASREQVRAELSK